MAYVFPNVKIYNERQDNADVTVRASVLATTGNANWTGAALITYLAPTLTISALTAGATLGLIDSIEPVAGDRILIRSLAFGGAANSAVKFGIWRVTGGTTVTLTLERADDFTIDSAALSATTIVRKGTLFANSGWIQTADVVIDTGAQVWKNITPGSGTSVTALPISSGGTGAVSYTDKQLVEYDAATDRLVSTTSVRIVDIVEDAVAENELLRFTSIASAVNEFTITNAVTTAGPILSASGGDTNININLAPKGSGSVVVAGDGVFAGKLAIEELGGSDTVTITVPTLAASYTLTLPVDDGTSGQVLTTDGSGVLSWTGSAAEVMSFQIAAVQVDANSTSATIMAYFPWIDAVYNISTGTFKVNTAILRFALTCGATRTMVISAGTSSTTDVLGSTSVGTVSTTTYHSLTLTKPTADGIIKIYINRTSGGGASPAIYGMTLDFQLV